MSKNTILLGGWAAFSEMRGLSKKEDPETFGWMPKDEAFWYEDMRAALDTTPGAREFLRALKPEDSHRGTMVGTVEDKMSNAHSGASLSSLIAAYRGALRDWDRWVSEFKRDMLIREYKQKQIYFTSLIIFHNHLVYIGTPVTDDEGLNAAMEKVGVAFSDGEKPVDVAWNGGAALSTVVSLLDELRAMREEENAKWNARRLKQEVEYLEWNYKHPSRWFWSKDRHPRYSIRPDEMAEMERLHPGYRHHMDLVCENINHMGSRAGVAWSPENSAALDKRLVELGIAK